eukprot:CAMPEP_0174737302 /NCGR_PEP_ID=MMETSP1094-20130205/68092_1 /TAXON_ID=156173 /ORGANISM="Chrysochromulina brevifilum, Strain UTEX LB 985" /LENGTH=129 /DNA_ID=CAMNT_0015940513 /DNA_START=125 /DNA_END=514 /DNA_ORIENTATION=+
MHQGLAPLACRWLWDTCRRDHCTAHTFTIGDATHLLPPGRGRDVGTKEVVAKRADNIVVGSPAKHVMPHVVLDQPLASGAIEQDVGQHEAGRANMEWHTRHPVHRRMERIPDQEVQEQAREKDRHRRRD